VVTHVRLASRRPADAVHRVRADQGGDDRAPGNEDPERLPEMAPGVLFCFATLD
jgi:hypothetical protein